MKTLKIKPGHVFQQARTILKSGKTSYEGPLHFPVKIFLIFRIQSSLTLLKSHGIH